MKFPRLRTILLAPVAVFITVYIAGAVMLAFKDDSVEPLQNPVASNLSIAIFGASGTAGDGILKAALANPDIGEIHVFTRRVTPRMKQGVDAGKVIMTLHTDYLYYTPIREQIAAVDATYWAIGLSSLGVDEETYGMIHVDFPTRFVAEWLEASTKDAVSFHYISSSDISEDSSAMWAREKIRAEQSLFALAANTHLRVIAYRPDYIGPTEEEAHLGQKLLYGFFRPVGAAVKAEQIGQAMFEVTARPGEFDNGAKLTTRGILLYSDAYERRAVGHR